MSAVPRDDDVLRAPRWDEQGPPPWARRHVRSYARTLARSCLAPGVQVVLGQLTGWHREAISTGQPAPLALDLIDLMIASEAAIVPVERMPSPVARAAAAAWGTERLVLAPALFGHDVLAVGLAALPAGVRPDLLAAEEAGEILAAALTAYRLGLTMRLASA